VAINEVVELAYSARSLKALVGVEMAVVLNAGASVAKCLSRGVL
jgi:hypothetical protein